MSTAKIARLPDAVAAHCLAFLDSAGHSTCARVCTWFRGLALLHAGFPDTVRILSPQRAAQASPALAQMRPRRLFEIRVTNLAKAGVVGRLLSRQTRARHIILADATDGQGSVWIVMNRAIGECEISPAGGGGNDIDVDEKRPACRRLDLRMRPHTWEHWFVTLAQRLPNLVRLELCEFPEHQWMLLRDGVPRLVRLRVERDCDEGDGLPPEARSDTDFSRLVLSALVHLRSLELPYATVRHRDLFVAGDRLESLEVRTLTYAEAVGAYELETQETVMARLTRLVAAVSIHTAAAILERMPHVCRGELTFHTIDSLLPTQNLVARISGPYDERIEDSDDDTSNADNDADNDERTAVGGEAKIRIDEREKRAGGTRIVWTRGSTASSVPPDPGLAYIAILVVLELRFGRHATHSFDSSVPDDMRRQICARLRSTEIATSPTIVARLPDAVATRCFSFLESAGHSACARVCVWFRRLALLPVGFPESVRILAPQHAATASPALAQMRPRRLIEIRVANFTEPGVVGRLLDSQTRVRHIVLADGTTRDSRGHSGCGYRVDMNRAYESAVLDRDDPLPACARLDVQVRPSTWDVWFAALAARLPNLVRLELCEFSEQQWKLLCDGVPQLTTLRISEGRDSDSDVFDLNFARHLLANLVHLRALALPYATVRHCDLFLAADRLESLEVRSINLVALATLDTAPPAPRSPSLSPSPTPTPPPVGGSSGRKTAPVMSRLTRLVTTLGYHTAANALASMPHVCRGALTFPTVFEFGSDGCLTAHLDHTRRDQDDDGDGADDDDERWSESGGAIEADSVQYKRRGGGSSGGDDGGDCSGYDGDGGRRVAWTHAGDYFVGAVDASLVPTVVRAMSMLRAEWSAHDFAESVTDDARRQICVGLPVTRSPPPSKPSVVA